MQREEWEQTHLDLVEEGMLQKVSTISDEDWAILPVRARLLISAGFVDADEVIKGWREAAQRR